MKHFALSIMFVSAGVVSCGGKESVTELDQGNDPLGYDDSTYNFKAEGTLLGAELSFLEATKLKAHREYEAPAVVGQRDMPDLARAYLVSVEIEGEIMRDGKTWQVKLDIEGDNLNAFAVGSVDPQADEIQFQLENKEAGVDLEDVAAAGSVEILKYTDSGALAGSDKVRTGGDVGGTFDITLETNGERVTGAFHASFDEPEVDLP